MKSLYSAVRTGVLNKAVCPSSSKGSSTVEKYCGLETYLHAFVTTAQDGNVPLTSMSDRYLPTDKNNRYALKKSCGLRVRMDDLEMKIYLSLNFGGNRTTFVQTVGQTLYSLSFVHYVVNSLINLFLSFRSRVRKSKQEIQYLSSFDIMSNSHKTSYVYWTVLHLYSCVKRKKTNLMPLILLFNIHSLFNMFRPLIRPSSGVCD